MRQLLGDTLHCLMRNPVTITLQGQRRFVWQMLGVILPQAALLKQAPCHNHVAFHARSAVALILASYLVSTAYLVICIAHV